jgi:hypothetical protein
MSFTKPIDNPFSRSRVALDANRQPETIDQSRLPGRTLMLSPRVGFNWDVNGDQSMRPRGGGGVFTGRVPFVWIGNVITNPGANPNLYPTGPQILTRQESVLQQSFDLNAMTPGFKWPQTWTTNLAAERELPWLTRGTLDLLYAKDLHNVFMRNADLVATIRTLADGRPYYGGSGANELNPDGGAGIYVIDNTSKGYSLNVTAQLRRPFLGEGSVGVGYSFTDAKDALKSTEIQQDSYLGAHRGRIAERFGFVNPWYSDVDVRVQQDFALQTGARAHGIQVSLDVMNVGNLLNSGWGVRKVANASATSPLTLVRFDPDGTPVFNFTGPAATFIDDPDVLSRWRAQVGLRYFFR